MFDILTEGISISPSSGVKFAVNLENASKALPDLETKLLNSKLIMMRKEKNLG